MFEAKTRFSEIARRVKATGRPVRVTNRGKPLVDIAPAQPDRPARRSRREVLAEIARFSKTLPKTSLARIRADIADGRR